MLAFLLLMFDERFSSNIKVDSLVCT